MALLTRKADGGHIIRTRAAGFTTFQVSEEGVAFLKGKGIDVNDNVPRWLFNHMRSTGLAFTTNTGIQSEPLPSPVVNSATQPSNIIALSLTIEEDEQGWFLSIMFPKLPLQWIQEISSTPSSLEKCGFYVDDNPDEILSVARLWPGKGGIAWRVTPHADTYKVNFAGTWPENWDFHSSVGTVDGLKPLGTLFSGEENSKICLRVGTPIIPGSSYYFVSYINSINTFHEESFVPLPSSLQPQLLGQQGEWRAWMIKVPSSVSIEIHDWFTRIGHPLAKPSWKLSLISPPPLRYSVDGLPIMVVGTEAIFVASPPVADVIQPIELFVECNGTPIGSLFLPTNMQQGEISFTNEACYFALPLKFDGEYKVYARAIDMTLFTFMVEANYSHLTPETITQQPLPLKVSVTSSLTKVHLYAFDVVSDKISLPKIFQRDIPSIEVECPVLADIICSCGAFYEGKQKMPSSEVKKYVAEHLQISLDSGQMFTISFDAGNFGTVCLHLFPALEESVHTPDIENKELIAAIVQRAQWLSLAIPALMHQDVVPIPHNIQTSLSHLKYWYQNEQLANLTYIPRVYLPHLHMLTWLLNTSIKEN